MDKKDKENKEGAFILQEIAKAHKEKQQNKKQTERLAEMDSI